jgi:hypothetical protein
MARKESTMNPTAIGDMDIVCPETGKPFRSRGLYQLSECYYGHIPDPVAFDPKKNMREAMKIISQGKERCMSQFTSCRKYYQLSNSEI